MHEVYKWFLCLYASLKSGASLTDKSFTESAGGMTVGDSPDLLAYTALCADAATSDGDSLPWGSFDEIVQRAEVLLSQKNDDTREYRLYLRTYAVVRSGGRAEDHTQSSPMEALAVAVGAMHGAKKGRPPMSKKDLRAEAKRLLPKAG